MTDPKAHRTSNGRTLTNEDIDALAAEVEETDHTTASEIIREAIRRCLEVA